MAPQQDAAPQRQMVLVVEDAASDIALVRAVLGEDPRWKIVVCHTLGEALELAPQADAVLLDLGLPDSDGLPTLARVRRVAPKAAIVVLTGTEDSTIGSEAIRLGAQDYVLKGDQRHALLPQVLEWAVTREGRTLHDDSVDPREVAVMDRAEGLLVAAHTMRLHRLGAVPLMLLLAEFRVQDHGYDGAGRALRRILDELLVRSFRPGDLIVHLEGTRFLLILPNDFTVGPTTWLESTLAQRQAAGLKPALRLSVGVVAVGPDDPVDLSSLMGLAGLLLSPTV